MAIDSNAEGITLKDVTTGKYTARVITGMTPLSDGETYARITDGGKLIEQYSYKTGQKVATLFDVNTTVGEKISSLDSYIPSPDGKKLLIATNTNTIYRRSFSATYYIYNIADRRMRPLSDNGPVQNPVWSPDGNVVAFVRDNNIHLVKLLYDCSESQVTKDGKKNCIINGIPDWVYEEEFSFSNAMAFTADSRMICWLRYDESKVSQYTLLSDGQQFKYPLAGEDNSIVTAWSYDIQSHQTRQLNVPVPKEGYIPRIIPIEETDKVLFMTLNRHQDEMAIYKTDARATTSQQIISETAKPYLREQVYQQMKVTSQSILLPSDRNGFMGAYLYSLNGQLKRKIEIPDTEITAIYEINETTGDVFFQAAQGVTQRQVMVSHANGKIETLNGKEGFNGASFSKGGRYYMHNWSDVNNPYVFTLCQSNGKALKVMEDNAKLKATISQAFRAEKKFFTFTTSEGVQLNGFMILPENYNPQKKYPVVMTQYSGPGSQNAVNSWHAGSNYAGWAYEQYLAQEGYISVCVDGRGTGNRGAKFEKQTYMHLGLLEAKDQVETALWLKQQPYVDGNRIAIWGWSYGGFNTLMSMSEGRAVFSCGIAVAPPTTYRYYDTVYTERYMRTPQENPDGYDDNPISRAAQLSGELLLIHGLSDDNVHPENTFHFADALVKNDKDYSELIYNGKNHGIYGGNTRLHLFRQITKFIKRNN